MVKEPWRLWRIGLDSGGAEGAVAIRCRIFETGHAEAAFLLLVSDGGCFWLPFILERFERLFIQFGGGE